MYVLNKRKRTTFALANVDAQTNKSDEQNVSTNSQGTPDKVTCDMTYLCTKKVLNTKEVARYLGVSESYIYRLTMYNIIPYYKSVTGRINFFDREEVEKWALTHKSSTSEEINDRVREYLTRNKRRTKR